MLTAALRMVPQSAFAIKRKRPFQIGTPQSFKFAVWLAYASMIVVIMAGTAAADMTNDMQDCFLGGNRNASIQACTRILDRDGVGNGMRAIVLNQRALERCWAGDFAGARNDLATVLQLSSILSDDHADIKKAKKLNAAVAVGKCDASAIVEAAQTDDASDCRDGRGDTALRGCSNIIKSRSLFGKPISNKNLAMTYHNRAVVYSRKGQYDRAIADISQAIKLNPKDTQFYYSRGVTYGDNGQFDRAIADYNMAIKLKLVNAGIYNDRGVAYRFLGQFDRAIADYSEAIKLDPKFTVAYRNRGLAYEKLGHNYKASMDFLMTIRLRPGDKWATSGLKRLGITP